MMAIGVMKAILEIGKSIPKDIAVAGFDDIDVASVYTPALTTVHQPFELKGESVMSQMLKLLNGKEVERQIVHKYKIVIRESI